MDLRNIQPASAAGGGLQIDRENGRLAQERNESDITQQSKASFSAPQDQIDFSQDALRGSVIAASVQSTQQTEGTDGRNSRSGADKGAVLGGANAGSVTSGGAKQTERSPPPPGLSLEKLSGDLIYEYADINGAHSSITSPLQSTDSSRNGINADSVIGGIDPRLEAPETESENALAALRPETENDTLTYVSEDVSLPTTEAIPASRLAASQSAAPGTILDLRS